MEEEKLNQLIIVEQLPKITQQLQTISEEIDKEISFALSMECTEGSKQEVKKAKARLNNIGKMLEERRKQVKQAISQPYMEFETIYNELVKEKLANADNELKEKISVIEEQQKQEKETEIRNFAGEYFNKYMLNDYFKFEDMKLNITLSASEKSLKEQTISFCEKVSSDLKLIDMEEYRDEILYEYIRTLDFANSKMNVLNKKKELEELQKVKEEQQVIVEKEKEIVQRVEEIVEEITAPKEIETTTLNDSEDQYVVSFTIKGSKSQLKKLKDFMKKEGIIYE